jgi:hypothetical protein
MPANNRPAARVKMASFRGDGLPFRYPAAWTARRWPLLGTSMSMVITYLTQARLHDRCKPVTRPGVNGFSCRGPVLDDLPAGDVLITWSAMGMPDFMKPVAGERQVIDGHRAIVSYSDPRACETRGVQVGMAAVIYRDLPGNWYVMTACLRGPGLRAAEGEVRAMLRSVRVQQG